jgi:Putative restriction endonuclease
VIGRCPEQEGDERDQDLEKTRPRRPRPADHERRSRSVCRQLVVIIRLICTRPRILRLSTSLLQGTAFVPGRPGETIPEPDKAAYHAFPLDLPLAEILWEDVSPPLVAVVLSRKDLVRNVILYQHMPTICEHWILDTRINPEQPMMLVHRRGRGKWQRPRESGYGETYTTKLLPGSELLVDPRN